jgi:hypothetical protein
MDTKHYIRVMFSFYKGSKNEMMEHLVNARKKYPDDHFYVESMDIFVTEFGAPVDCLMKHHTLRELKLTGPVSEQFENIYNLYRIMNT